MPVRRARPLWFWYLPSVLLLVVAGNQLALRLTLLDILLRPIGNWFLQPLLLGSAAVGVALPGQLQRPPLWIALTALTALRVTINSDVRFFSVIWSRSASFSFTAKYLGQTGCCASPAQSEPLAPILEPHTSLCSSQAAVIRKEGNTEC
jgi:hypothetical protein